MNPRSRLLLLAVLVLALVTRTVARDDRARAGDDVPPAAESLDDPRTAAHLVRIEQALAGSATRYDRFLDPTRETQAPWLAFYDRALGALAERVSGLRGSPLPAGAEARLESLLVRLGPLLGVVATLAVFWAAARAARGASAVRAGLFAAALFAVFPGAVAQSAFARLDANAWLALLCALEIALLVRALRARAPLELLSGTLFAGLVAGVAVATSPVGIAFFAAGWLGLLVLALRGPREMRGMAQRAGLLFCAVASFASHLPHIGDAAEASPLGLLAGWSTAIGRWMLASAIPFLLGFLLSDERKGRGRMTQSAILAIALVAIVGYLPQAWAPVRELASAWAERRDVLTLVFADHRALLGAFDVGRDLSTAILVVAVFPLAAWRLVRRTRAAVAGTDEAGTKLSSAPDLVFLLALGGLLAPCALFLERIVGVAVVPIAITVGLAVADGLARADERGRATARFAVAIVVLLVAADALRPWLARGDAGDARERAAYVAGLRSLRASEPGGVVSAFPGSGLVEYHARRPLVGSAFDALGDEETLRAVSRALLASEPHALVRLMRAERARYLVVAPRDLRHRRELVALAGTHARDEADAEARVEASLLARLAFADPASQQDSVPGFVRIHASDVRVTVDGRPAADDTAARDADAARSAGDTGARLVSARAGPAVSVYRLDVPEQPFRSAEIEAR